MKLRCRTDSNPIAPSINQLTSTDLPRASCPKMSSWLISARFLLRHDHSQNTGVGRAFLFADPLSVNVLGGTQVCAWQ